VLLSLAETLVRNGYIGKPLQYYNELTNGTASWLVNPGSASAQVARVFQLCSTSVRRLCAATAICPDGIRSEWSRPCHILVLISSSFNSITPYEGLRRNSVRLLQPDSHREALLKAETPAEAWSVLSRLDSEIHTDLMTRN